MLDEMKPFAGKVLTVRGPVEPAKLGRVLMHEHLHSDPYDWSAGAFVVEERPPAEQRRQYLLTSAVPLLRQCRSFGCHGYVEVTPAPWRAWPTLYVEVAGAADCHIVLATGYYREMEVGTYWVKKPQDRMWPFVANASVEELADFCITEIASGVHGTKVRAGAIKLGTSAADMTELEEKTFRAGARAQAATGAHVTTHCTKIGAESSQLRILEKQGADLSRVVIGHTAGHLTDPACRKVCLKWMKRGVNFLPTNLGVKDAAAGLRWRPLVEAIHAVFDAGQGDKLCLGLDSGYCSESGAFGPMTFLPPEPFTHMFTHTLPAFRAMGLTPPEEEAMLRVNPQRILPIQ